MTATSDQQQLAYVATQAAEARVNVELDTGDMALNIGPQHPATHGTLRIAAQLDGELVVKADIDDSMTIDTWTDVYPGADWHEREAWEMFGVTFAGHPRLRNLYLPSGFEGHPLRKDYPLLARVVKPWPGIVDIEDIPEHLEEQLEAEVMAAFEAEGGGA